MRTSLWIAVGLLIVVAAAGVLTSAQMREISDRYVAVAEELFVLAAQEDWNRSAETAASCLAGWRGLVPKLQMLINHDDTDAVTLALVRLQAAIAARDAAGALTACAELRENAQHLYHRDAFTWANVL